MMNLKAALSTAKILASCVLLSGAIVFELETQIIPFNIVCIGLICVGVCMLTKIIYGMEKDRIETVERIRNQQ